MSTVKLTTNLKWKAGRTHVLPVVGQVTWDEDASIEVHEDHVEALKKHMPELDPDAVIIKPQVRQDELNRGRAADEDIAPQIEEAAPLEDGAKKEDMIAMLSGMKKAELQELAESFPKEEWESLKKEELQDYLAQKL